MDQGIWSIDKGILNIWACGSGIHGLWEVESTGDVQYTRCTFYITIVGTQLLSALKMPTWPVLLFKMDAMQALLNEQMEAKITLWSASCLALAK